MPLELMRFMQAWGGIFNYDEVKVIGVYDFDTITTDIDREVHAWIPEEKLHLARINAPEVWITEELVVYKDD